jgi:hypothetical protein
VDKREWRRPCRKAGLFFCVLFRSPPGRSAKRVFVPGDAGFHSRAMDGRIKSGHGMGPGFPPIKVNKGFKLPLAV